MSELSVNSSEKLRKALRAALQSTTLKQIIVNSPSGKSLRDIAICCSVDELEDYLIRSILEAYEALVDELFPAYMSRVSIETELLVALFEVRSKPGFFSNSRNIRQKIVQLGDEWKPALSTFEVIYTFENLPRIDAALSFGGVEFFRATTEWLTGWGSVVWCVQGQDCG